MYAVGMLGSYLSQGVYAIAGPLQPLGGAVDIIVVQQEDGTFKSSPWYVKFGDFQGNQEKIVHIAVNDSPADFHMCLDSKGEAYFEKEVESDETTMVLSLKSASSSSSSSSGEDMEESETQVPAGASMDSRSCLQAPLAMDSINIANEVTKSMDGIAIQEPPSTSSREAFNEHDREAPNMDAPAGLVTGEELSMEAAYTGEAKEDNDSMCSTHFVTMIAENSSRLEELQVESIERAGHEGGHVSSMTVINNIEILQNSYYSDDGGSCVQSVTFRGTENTRECYNDLSIENNVVMDEMTEKDTLDLYRTQTDYRDNGGLTSDLGLDNDGKVDDFEGGTVESVGNEHMFDDANNDETGVSGSQHVPREYPLAMDSDEPVSGGVGGVLMAISESNTSSSDEGGGKLAMDSSEDPIVQDLDGLVSQDARELVLATSESGSFLLEEKGGELSIDNSKEAVDGNFDVDVADDAGNQVVASSSSSRWSLWWFLPFRRSRVEKVSLSASSASNQVLMDAAAAANMPMEGPFTEEPSQKNGYLKTKVRTYVPTSAQLFSLRLKDGPNKVTFAFSKARGKTEVDARIYLWKWNTRIVVSDVDGTITKSDVLGQVMPLVGRDWSQYGVTRLFSAIKDNGFEVLFLSARAISQAYLTRRFLLNLKQDGEALPEGPVFISPDGLIPSLYREVIRRAPHEFKISCLEGIRELFPNDVNPFYAGFGNRETDVISYLKVGIPRGKIFIINPKGEVVVDRRVDCKSYTSLHSLVDDMFPPMSSHEQEDFNTLNFWKMPLPDINDELNAKSSKNAKRGGNLKK